MAATFLGGTVFHGRSAGGRLGAALADAGDLDGDGLADLVFGAPDASIRDADGGVTLLRPGETVVVFGRPAGFPEAVYLAALAPGEGAVVAETSVAGAGLGAAVAGGGDLDGNGRDDLLVGAPLRRVAPSGTEEGAVHAIDGTAVAASGQTVDAGTAAAGRTLLGEAVRSEAGRAAAIADLDGDGHPDAILGVPGYSPGMEFGAGGVAVLWGGTGFDLPGSLGLLSGAGSLLVSGDAEGLAIRGAAALDEAGRALAAGDVTGDGIADILIGAPEAHASGPLIGGVRPGAVYLVAGGSRREAVDLGGADPADPDPALTVRFLGEAGGDLAGAAVAAVGDVNGDGIGDILVGAPGAAPGGLAGAGAAYVVFGRAGAWPAEVPLGGPGTVRITLAEEGAALGAAVAAAGDVNGDGLDDLLLGAPGASPGGRQGAGAVWLVMGRPDPWPASLDLGALGLDAAGRREGYVLEGAADFDAAGSALAALGDRNGDGVPDFGIGAPGADGPGGGDAGMAVLVHGGAAMLAVLDAEDGAEDGRIALASVATIDPAANPLLFAAAPAGGRIDGTAASEVFLGGDGPDTLVGHGGEDSFVGGAGIDRITGGAGRDRVDAGPGNDVVKTEGGDDIVWLGDGDDTALSGDGDDTVYGGAGDDVIKASLGDDVIHGGEGADNISGWRGRDTIFGGPGDDVIRGDFDEDRIEGGPGNDRLLGGPGRDTFVFRMGFDEDRLLDYNPVLEKLDFSLHEGVESYQDLAISQVGTSVVILDGSGGRIVLANVDMAQISAGDFIF